MLTRIELSSRYRFMKGLPSLTDRLGGLQDVISETVRIHAHFLGRQALTIRLHQESVPRTLGSSYTSCTKILVEGTKCHISKSTNDAKQGGIDSREENAKRVQGDLDKLEQVSNK